MARQEQGAQVLARRGGGRGPLKAGKVEEAGGKAANKVVLPRSLYERLNPRSDGVIMQQVQGELSRAASCGFQQLNSRFPGASGRGETPEHVQQQQGSSDCSVQHAEGSADAQSMKGGQPLQAVSLDYSRRDLALQQLLRQQTKHSC